MKKEQDKNSSEELVITYLKKNKNFFLKYPELIKELNFSLKDNGSDKVIEVDLLFKPSNSNSIYVIERFKKSDYGWANNSKQTYTFTNSKIYTVLGSDELLRLYDNVPLLAKAQPIIGNRLMYGNYIENYNLLDKNILPSYIITKKSIENIELAKTQSKNSVVIEKKSNRFAT